MNLLIDFINPQGTRGFATRLDKITHNLDLMPQLQQSIAELKKTNKTAFSSMTVCGRWIVIYQANVANDDDTLMHFIDFRIDITSANGAEIFSESTIKGIISLQNKYDKVFISKYDTVELTYAEPYEKTIKPNFFACDIDDIVLQKAKALGVLPMIESLSGNDKVKVVIADEKVTVDNNNITNIYAVLHFGGHTGERANENGFAYLKIYDLFKNFDKIDDLQNAVEEAGGKFDRTFFMERFNNAKLN